jgi:hypothetical protein
MEHRAEGMGKIGASSGQLAPGTWQQQDILIQKFSCLPSADRCQLYAASWFLRPEH